MTQNMSNQGGIAKKEEAKKRGSFLSDDNFEFDVSGGFKLSLFNKDKT
mgnify:CR=1 FL=1